MGNGDNYIQLHVGEEHPIRLESLRTAGYEWQPMLEGEPIAQIARAGNAGSSDAVGASPDEVFTIKALRPGRTTVRFAQRRPWEHDAEPSNEHVVQLDVS